MFTYHYCAQYQVAPGKMGHIDGIATLKKKIKSMDDYRELKRSIDSEYAENLTITSLSLI